MTAEWKAGDLAVWSSMMIVVRVVGWNDARTRVKFTVASPFPNGRILSAKPTNLRRAS